mgnify:CR=1 FL=1
MNGYRYIRNAGAGYRKIRPFETVRVHEYHRNWLHDRLYRPHPGRTVVITHHCPPPNLISHEPGELDPIYGSDLIEIISKFQPDAWFFGQTHHRLETTEGETLIPSVPIRVRQSTG